MFLTTLFVAYVEFPDQKDAIFRKEDQKTIDISTSGSLGIYYSGKCHQTYGNETLVPNEEKDWVSNIANDGEKSFIQYSIKNKKMKIYKYAIRNGCCDFASCCTKTGEKISNECCCRIYGYSLHASNDNRTWIKLHKVDKDEKFYYCLTKVFDLPTPVSEYKYYRFVQDKEFPGCPRCMQINQIEFYGETIDYSDSESDEDTEEDESVSIIGRVKKDE